VTVLIWNLPVTACRINEACTLKVMDAYDTAGRVRPKLIIRKQNTKGKLATRTIPVIEDLAIDFDKLPASSRARVSVPWSV
jgi:integrase/recombinase XerD